MFYHHHLTLAESVFGLKCLLPEYMYRLTLWFDTMLMSSWFAFCVFTKLWSLSSITIRWSLAELWAQSLKSRLLIFTNLTSCSRFFFSKTFFRIFRLISWNFQYWQMLQSTVTASLAWLTESLCLNGTMASTKVTWNAFGWSPSHYLIWALGKVW